MHLIYREKAPVNRLNNFQHTHESIKWSPWKRSWMSNFIEQFVSIIIKSSKAQVITHKFLSDEVRQGGRNINYNVGVDGFHGSERDWHLWEKINWKCRGCFISFSRRHMRRKSNGRLGDKMWNGLMRVESGVEPSWVQIYWRLYKL